MKTKNVFEVDGRKVVLTNLEKVLFPAINGTKAELIEYYMKMASYVLPYTRGRPFSMLHFPDGVDGKSFYQKQRPDEAPEWLKSAPIPSEHKTVEWCLVNDLPSLLYMANRACIEMHTWFSRLPDLDSPDIAVFDIDPSGNTGYAQAAEAALLIRVALREYALASFPKLSGATGVHVVIPIAPVPYAKVRAFLKSVCAAVVKAYPDRYTLERTIVKRGDRVYLDAVQNARGKTLPSPYSVRATPAATVSAPVTWYELEKGVSPGDFTMRNIGERLKKKGDLFAPVYEMRQILPEV